MARENQWPGRVGWLIALLGPPSGVAAFASGWIRNDPILAGLVLVGYAILVGMIGFFAGVASKVGERWKDRLVDVADRTFWRLFSRFARRYRSLMLSSLRFIDLKGLATIGAYTPELDEVFVELFLVPRGPHQVSAGLLADVPPEAADRLELWSLLSSPRPRILTVIGVAGSGKTTLLRHTARRLCRLRKSIPILLLLRDHASKIVADPAVSLSDVLRDTLGRHRAEEPDGWFEQRLNAGKCVVLLDGLDEVAAEADRRTVGDWVESQIRQYPRNHFVIASRPQGYEGAHIDGATVLQVRRFTDEQVATFVHCWYAAAERYSIREDAEELEVRAEAAANDLLDRLRNTPALYELTVNPLLLTMITNVHRYRGALPGSRADLYKEICEVVLWRRHAVKRLPVRLDGDQKELVLRGLAFTMMERRVRDLSRSDIVSVIRPALERVSRQIDDHGFLADIQSNGLMIVRDNGLYAFVHHTVQEYLAAAYIRDKGLTTYLSGLVEDSWWRECTLLYAAGSDGDPIIRACLDSDTVTALALAFDCADEASEIEPTLRDRLDVLLESAFDPGTDEARRRLMTNVLVTRQLRRLTMTVAGARVCTRPIGADIYRLYLIATDAPAPDDPSPFVAGSNRPVTGVRPEDAHAFVGWVNEIVAGEIVYRLPSAAELDDPAVWRALARPGPQLSIWVQERTGTVLRTPDEHPHTVAATVLRDHVLTDVDTARGTLVRLLLYRSVIVSRALTHHLGRSGIAGEVRPLGDNLVRCLQRAVELAPAGTTLATATGPALDKAKNLRSALDRAQRVHDMLDTTHQRDVAHRRGVNRALALDMRSALAPDVHPGDPRGDLDRYLSDIGTLAEMLATDLDRARYADPMADLDRMLGFTATSVLDLAVAPPRDPEQNLRLVLGGALTDALAHALTKVDNIDADERTRSFTHHFGLGLHARTCPREEDRRVGPDDLAGMLRRASAEVQPGWAAQVAGRLAELALPICARQRPIDPASATAIRIAALCLAEQAGDTPPAVTFREIAAGVTLLERRRNGDTPPTESIILAAG
jgi:hypothetical protein